MEISPAAIGPYRVVRRLGEGGMGAVFEARDTRDPAAGHESVGRSVALKVLLPEYSRDRQLTERLLREARALSRLRHPAIVEVFDYGQQPDGTAYLAMEYLQGETLSDWHKLHPGAVPAPWVLHFAEQLASALAAAHQQGIVHRDVKAGNIMLLGDDAAVNLGGVVPRVKLLDFGLAKLVQDTQGHKAKTATDVIMGTPYYMSPEQCQGAGYVGTESDVYSLGVVLFELLAGRLPFEAEGSGRLLAMHMFQEPPHLRQVAPAVPAGLADLVHTLLAKEPGQRPSMAALAQELARMVREGGAPTTSPLALTYMAARRKPGMDTTFGRSLGQSLLKRRQRPLIGVGMALLALSAIVVFWLVHKPPSPPASSPPPAAPAAAPLPIRWVVTSAPPGAAVLRADDDKVLGATPWTSEQPPTAGALLLRLRLPGYADEPLTLERDISQKIHLTLRPQPRPPKAAPAASAPRRDSSTVRKPATRPTAEPKSDFTFEK